MGVVLAFPSFQVVAREEGNTRGEPREVIDPRGRRHPVLVILRRRLVASRDPASPIRHEFEVGTDIGEFLVSWTDPAEGWEVEPL